MNDTSQNPAPADHPNSDLPYKANQIVAARMKLRDRFLKKTNATPALSDENPLGSGPLNRHGMPALPPGQAHAATGKWPVLDLGHHPKIPLDQWRLTVDGHCKNPFTLTWEQFLALEQTTDTSDFHCVTAWSKLDIEFEGVLFSTIAAIAEPHDDAEHILTHAYDTYTTNLPLAEALKDDVLLVHHAQGEPLPIEHGGPCRMITPQLWAWKGAKWINRIQFLKENQPGFWEQRGYSNTAHPWRNDRYS